jgi:AmmeMemoRadiSam system protein A
LAYESIASAFGNDGGAVVENGSSGADGGASAAFAAPGAAFVTLTLDGRLRGCIGSLAARRPLGEDVAANARAAAFEDPRFPELTEAELKRADIEVSVLTEPRPMKPEDPTRGLTREEVERRLLPGFDGAVLTYGAHRGTFLPQVWNQLPQPYDFVSGLLRKAGLPPNWWDPAIEVETYRVQASHLLR